MGCKQSTKMRKHSYLSDTLNRPVDCLFNKNIYIDDLPKFVNSFIYQYNMHQLTYIKGEYKDLFFSDNKVYGIEIISETEFSRRIVLQDKIKNIKNVVMYKEMFYLENVIIGVMDRHEIDMFELLKTCQINLDDFVKKICCILKKLHKNGIYIQDLKPENIFVDITETEFIYNIGDIEYALFDADFDTKMSRLWVRTLNYSPNLNKPKTCLEAMRNDYYSLAVIIGRIETFYNNEIKLNVFCEARKGVFEEGWDDRYKLKGENLKYSKFCSDFIVEKLFYKQHVQNFLSTLLDMSQQQH